MSRPVIFIMGPTAIGKSTLAMDLAQHLPIEIVSVDSAMVYRGMDIGTNKPTPADQKEVPHHLLDIRDPSEIYSAAEFQKEALACIESIQSRSKIPVLVGGTIFYFQSLEKGLSPLPSADQSVRDRLSHEAEQYGWPALHQRLDPESARRIHPNDAQRIQRALEIYETTERPMSDFFTQSRSPLAGYCVHRFARVPVDRSQLHQQIETRFREMLAQGFVEEVEQLRKRGDLHSDLPSMRSVGYRQIWQYLDGEIDFSTMVEKGVAATRQLAKRQLTWIRSLENVMLLANTHSASLKTVIESLHHRN